MQDQCSSQIRRRWQLQFHTSFAMLQRRSHLLPHSKKVTAMTAATIDRFRLNDSLALITGGAGLLGRQHAAACLDAGAAVCLVDINAGGLEEAKGQLQQNHPDAVISCFTADITTEAELLQLKDAIHQSHGRLPDVLINNAAIDSKFDQSQIQDAPSRLENFPLANWHKEISVGLTGSFLCAKVFGTEMARNNKGTIVNVASDLGLIAPNQSLYRREGLPEDRQPVKPVTYSVIKHGLIGMTKYLATYWAAQGVRCNALAPGGVFNNHDDGFVQRISPLIPMGRMAHPHEYQAALVFLCSAASSYMTGAVLAVDGGRTAW